LNDQDAQLADGVRRNVYALVSQLAETHDPQAFAALGKPLTEAAQTVAERGDAATLWKLLSVLHEIAAEGVPADPLRATVAASFVRSVSNPPLLAPIARLALTPTRDQDACARRVLVLGRARGAHALYSARMRNDAPEARAAFVAILQEIGAAAAPVVRAALERLEDRLDDEGSHDLICDLLLGLAPNRDEGVAKVIARLARSRRPRVAQAAAAARERTARETPRPAEA
jgi:hypothetical protein